MVRRIAVRKILKAHSAVRSVIAVSAVSLALSAVGLIIYSLIVPSEVVLMEAFVWLIEAFSFGGLALAFKVAASRTITYRARYEILRLESLAALLVSVVAAGVTIWIALHAALTPHSEPSPMIVSAYPLASGVVSLILERRLHKVLKILEVRLVSVKMIAEKLALDVVFEIGGGLAIVVSNIAGTGLWESIAAVVMAGYVIFGLYGIAKEATLHLLGIVPRDTHRRLEIRIRRVLRRVTRFERIRRLKIESYGTFSEVELWLEAPETLSLGEAYYESMRVARELVHRIPELLRALVILVPARRIPLRASVGMRLSSEIPRSNVKRRISSRRLSSRLASQPSRGISRSSQPREVPQQRQSQQRQSDVGESQAS